MTRTLVGGPLLVAFAVATVAGQSTPLATPPTARPAARAPVFDRSAYAIPHRSCVLDNSLQCIVHVTLDADGRAMPR